MNPSVTVAAHPSVSRGIEATDRQGSLRRLFLSAFGCAIVALAAASVQPDRYSARARFVVLAPSQGGGAADVRETPDALSDPCLADRIIERLDLQQAWQIEARWQARARLSRRVTITHDGGSDDPFEVEAQDTDPGRAAALANAFVDEFRARRGMARPDGRCPADAGTPEMHAEDNVVLTHPAAMPQQPGGPRPWHWAAGGALFGFGLQAARIALFTLGGRRRRFPAS